MSSLFGQYAPVPQAESGDRPRTREFAVKVAEAITIERVSHGQNRPIGIPFLRASIERSMKQNRNEWPNIPSPEGLRKRIQECADGRFFRPRPLLHVPYPMKDIDPEGTSGIYDFAMRPTSCYIVNPVWEMAQNRYDLFELTKDFAFACFRLTNLNDLTDYMDGVKKAHATIGGIIDG